MSIYYYRLKRAVMINGQTSAKYVATVRRGRRLTNEDFGRWLESGSTVSAAEARLVIEEWQRWALHQLSEGDNVEMGTLGVLSPSITATAQDTPEAVDGRTVRTVGIHFRASRATERAMREAGLRLHSPKVYATKSLRNGDGNGG